MDWHSYTKVWSRQCNSWRCLSNHKQWYSKLLIIRRQIIRLSAVTKLIQSNIWTNLSRLTSGNYSSVYLVTPIYWRMLEYKFGWVCLLIKTLECVSRSTHVSYQSALAVTIFGLTLCQSKYGIVRSTACFFIPTCNGLPLHHAWQLQVQFTFISSHNSLCFVVPLFDCVFSKKNLSTVCFS